ncbi:MAG: hypothetical protein RLZZ234_214 [Candidatus Parcubacteria bacterium]
MVRKKNVVVIGGGTGTFSVLSGLKVYADELDISAVITMADSGGSTGKLRDEFGYLPVGDVRMALVALADEDIADQALLRKLFLHRFEKGGMNLAGHNFGNLLLVALTDIMGSETEAVRFASRLLHTKGNVLPVTTDNLTLVAEYDDGVVVRGETHIDEPEHGRDAHRIVNLTVAPDGYIARDAHEAILHADVIVFGPGDLYTSVLAVCVVPGVREAVQQSGAELVYISNLMSKYGQTTGMTVDGCAREIERYLGVSLNRVLVNNTPIPHDLCARYAEEGEYPVADDASRRTEHIDLLSEVSVVQSPSDTLKRSLVRHDSVKLARAILLL